MTAIDFPNNPQPGDAFLNFVWDGEKWRNAGSQTRAVILKDLFEFSVAADDSTQRTISTGESIKFIGAGTVTTASDTEGNITITGAATDFTGYATETFVTTRGYLTSVGTISYNDLTDKPSLFDGTYASLSGLPTLFSGSYNDLTDKPTLFSGSYTDLSSKPTIYSSAYIGTTSLDFTRSSGSQTLNGVSIDGSVLWINSTPAPGDPFRTAISAASGNASISLTSGLPGLGSTVSWTFDTTKITFPDASQQTTAWTGSVAYSNVTGTPTLATVATSGSYTDLSNKPTIPTTVTVNGTSITLGSSGTVTAAAGTLTGTTLNSTVVSSSLTSVGTLTGLAVTTTATGNAVNVTYTPPSANGAAYFATGKDTAGGTGYFDFLRATNTTSGATNATKTFRLNSTGTLQILNSAYGATIFSVTDAGFIAINASTSATDGVPVNNGIAMRDNSYIFDDGNYHITAKTGQIWLNSNDGSAVSINQQMPSGITAGGLKVTGPINAQSAYYVRTAWNSAIDTEITVDDYRFRISNQGGIFPQVISNTGGTKNSAWTVVAARSGSAITQTGSTGTLVPNNSWTSLYTSGGMDSAGDTFVATLQDKNQGRIYRVTFMRSDNGSTTGYNIIAERLL